MKTVALALFLLACIPSSGRTDCPVSHLSAGYAGHALQYDVTAAEADFEGGPVTAGGPCTACFSWPLWYFRASGYAATDWGAAVEAQERFELVGPVSATPLTFSARLRVSGSVQPYAQGRAGVGEGSSATQVLNVPGGQSPSNVPVVVNLQHFAGDTFDIHVGVRVGSAQAYSGADLQASFEFVGVPTGWSITSCHGLDVPVPNRTTTWGRLRATYR